MKITFFAAVTLLFISCKTSNTSENKQGKERPNVEQLIIEMDDNKDGVLSKLEVKGPLLTDFDKIDLDKNGFLSKEELQKATEKREDRPDKQGSQGNRQGPPSGGNGGQRRR